MTANMIFLLFLPTLAIAVSIRNYNQANCQGRYQQCSNINENVCCDRSTGNFQNNDTSFGSSAYNSLPTAGLGLACQVLGRNLHCGQVVDASWGDSACAGRGSDLTGSFWFTCQGCPFHPAGGGGDRGGNGSSGSNSAGTGTGGPGQGGAVYTYSLGEGKKQVEKKGIPAVKPDLISIDGHLFNINYRVPVDITEAIYQIFDNPALGYNDFSDDLLKFEVAVGYEEMSH